MELQNQQVSPRDLALCRGIAVDREISISIRYGSSIDCPVGGWYFYILEPRCLLSGAPSYWEHVLPHAVCGDMYDLGVTCSPAQMEW